MPEAKVYDLEERTFRFASDVKNFLKKLPMTTANFEYSKQLIRCSSSIGANYIEANESLSKKDFYYRCKICRKEAKESVFFLRLLDSNNDVLVENDRSILINEATQLKLIFNKIIGKIN